MRRLLPKAERPDGTFIHFRFSFASEVSHIHFNSFVSSPYSPKDRNSRELSLVSEHLTFPKSILCGFANCSGSYCIYKSVTLTR
jgi:hypothetical protein